jgi:hypothetical protein
MLRRTVVRGQLQPPPEKRWRRFAKPRIEYCINIQVFRERSMSSGALQAPQAIHESLCRATQLAGRTGSVLSCGDAALARELPGGGWPTGALTELLVPQDGCGELRLLRAPLSALAGRHVLLIRPPQRLQPAALAWWGLSHRNITVVHAQKSADVLWAAEPLAGVPIALPRVTFTRALVIDRCRH